MERLKSKKLFLLDMDGTIYIDNQLFDGVQAFLKYVKSCNGRYLFLTNNSSKSVDKYIEKLKSLGIESTREDFLTALDATVSYLEKQNYQKIYAFGTSAYRSQLRDAGFPIVSKREEGIDCLCMGFDTELTFEKLEDACILLNAGVDYIATNPDWVCPTQYGSVPDCGSIAQILCNATGRNPVFTGKPNPDMIYLALEKTGFSKEETVMIGDRLYTDIASGINAGVDSLFVLSGEGKREDIEKTGTTPTYVLNNIKELYDYLSK